MLGECKISAGQNFSEKIAPKMSVVSLVMSSNNCQFQDEHYTQINGATIGGPESASTTYIFGAIFLDEPALKRGAISTSRTYQISGRSL